MQQKLIVVTCLLFMSMSLLMPSSASATIWVYDLSMEFSEGSDPGGMAPWLTAILDDGGTPGSVSLTMEATNLLENEFVFEWLFNLDPALDPANLNFSAPTKTGNFVDPVISTGVNSFQADGDGLFDIQFVFGDTNGPTTKFGLDNKAVVPETVMYTITAPNITASSFDFLSEESPEPPPDDPGPFPTAAKVGGINDLDESGWISVPEPITFLFFAIGTIGISQVRRRRR